MKKIALFCLLFIFTSSAYASEKLKLGVLLIEDSVPFYIAEQEKFYDKHNVSVELIPFLSALERDSALVSGAIDGAITDPVGALLLDKGRGFLTITSLCLGKTPEEGVFAILASPKSGIEDYNALKNVEIAVSNSTIIEYVTDRLLEEKGFASEEIKKIEVKKMPIRMQMLLSGSVKAATLPEPLASIAESKGAKRLISDSSAAESLSQTVIIFRTPLLKEKKTAIASFFAAYGDAVEAVNANPEKYRDVFMEKGRIPPFLAKTYPIPVYPAPQPFSKELFTPIIEWLVSRQLTGQVEYAEIVSDDFME